MEADMVAAMLKEQEGKSVAIRSVIMDNDSTTSARIRDEIQREMNEIKDLSHTKNDLRTHLTALQTTHKIDTVVTFLQKCFVSVCTEHKNDPVNIKVGLVNITNHAFGNHKHCQKPCC